MIVLRILNLECSNRQFSRSANFKLLCRQRHKIASARRYIPPSAVKTSKLNELICHRFAKILNAQKLASRTPSLSTDYELDSLTAGKYIEQNIEKYDMIALHRSMKTGSTVHLSNYEDESAKLSYPLESVKLCLKKEVQQNSHLNAAEPSASMSPDRGFYVCADGFVDDYIYGSTCNILGGEFDEGNLDNLITRYGSENAVEDIDFQLPGQSAHEPEGSFEPETDNEKEWIDFHGTVDSSIPSSGYQCMACGANFHCKDASLPGFLPVEVFSKLNDYKEKLCRRCYMLKKHNFLLNVNVCEVDYRTMMDHLKLKQEALIIIVVDMTDLPNSIFASLPDIIGHQKPVIIVGNKVDLLPPDAQPGFLRNFQQTLYETVSALGLVRKFNVIHVALISAKTGYGIEELITNIFLRFSTRNSLRNDMYMVGCTNVGKSTLFNAFLQSDLCKVRALNLVERAATSPWPGTTISLLKFPVMNPSPYRLEIRRRRLLSNQAWMIKERHSQYKLLKESGDAKYATLYSYVENSFKDREDELQPPPIRQIVEGQQTERKKGEKIWNPDLDIFAKGKWCYDTPGTVQQDQVLNLFTLDELIAVLPRKMLVPRSFLVRPGESVLIGGVAQVDFIDISLRVKKKSLRDHGDRRPAVLATVFASDQLPVFIKKTAEVSDFKEQYLGTRVLAVPSGGKERISNFPKLEGRDMIVSSNNFWKGSADIVLSSIGWVCITSHPGEIRLRPYTPSGRGLHLRTKPILPFCAQLRGARIPYSSAYKVKPLCGPEVYKNTRRSVRK